MSDPTSNPPYPLDERSLLQATRIEITTGSGPGGQNRNKTQNAVRLIHEPSGVVVTATERRSLEQNRKEAFGRLVARLTILNRPKRKRKPTKPSRGSKERRLSAKKADSRIKAARKKPVHE